MRRARWMAPIAALAVGSIAIGCDASEPLPSAGPGAWRATSQGFVLDASMPRPAWSSSEEIQLTTTLTWTGAAASQAVGTFTGGPLTYGFKQVDGPLSFGSINDLMCTTVTFERGVVTPMPYRKSGGWDGNDPNGAFYQAFFKDPRLILPAGHWQISIGTDGYLGPCADGAPKIDAQLPVIDVLVR